MTPKDKILLENIRTSLKHVQQTLLLQSSTSLLFSLDEELAYLSCLISRINTRALGSKNQQ